MNNLTEQFIAKMKELFGINVIVKLQSSDHFSQGRGGKSIDTLTPHHMAGNLSINTLYNVLNAPDRQASCNIGIATNGDVAILVKLENRAWTSSSAANDNRAVTFEIANNGGAPNWSVSDLAKLRYKQCGIALAKVLGIKSFKYTGGTDGTITRHNMFSSTTCPGPNLQGSLTDLTREINEALSTSPTPTPTPTPTPSGDRKFKEGDKVTLKAGAPLYTSSDAANAAGTSDGRTTVITRTNGSKHYYNTTGDYGWMDEADITLYTEPTPTPTPQPEPTPTPSTELNIGDNVVFIDNSHWGIYTSYDSNNRLRPLYNGGKITAIYSKSVYPKAKNEYQLNNVRGYVRKEDIKKA